MTVEIALLALSAVGIYDGFRLSKSALLYTDPVGPGWYLFTVSILLLVCTLVVVWQRLIRCRGDKSKSSTSMLKSAAGCALLLLAFYGVGIMYLGYLVASVPYFILAQRAFGETSWRRCTLIGVTITGCFYLLFACLAGMPLP